MHPSTTTYRLAQAGGEFNKLYALMRRVGSPGHAGLLNFPTVVAERGGKVVGFLSTLPSDDGAVWAGPLVLEKSEKTTFIRLIEAYERVLQLAGVKAYLHVIETGREGHIHTMNRLGFDKVADTPEGAVMLRRL